VKLSGRDIFLPRSKPLLGKVKTIADPKINSPTSLPNSREDR